MKAFFSIFLSLFILGSLSAQSGRNRDAIKVGVNYVFLSQEDAFKPGLYAEFTRVFYPPITIGVGGSITMADDIVTLTEDRDLNTFSVDLNGYYAFLETDKNELQLGFGLSARFFKIEWLERDTEFTGTNTFLRPGLNILLNYNYIFDPIIIGFRTTVQTYSSIGAVYMIGGHLGIKF